MPDSSEHAGGGRRLLVAATVALALAGAVLLGVVVTRQEPAPPSPDAAAPSSGSPAAPAPAADPPTAAPEPAAVPALPASRPVSVTIPDLGVQTSLIDLGQDEVGEMQVPQDGAAVGWYTPSPTPGEIGPTVLAGHVTWDGGPAVFFDLGAMQPGQRVELAREDGARVVYEVTGVQQYPKDAFPTLDVYGNTSGPELRLITCGGEFDSSAGSHRDNIVVYARMLEVVPA